VDLQGEGPRKEVGSGIKSIKGRLTKIDAPLCVTHSGVRPVPKESNKSRDTSAFQRSKARQIPEKGSKGMCRGETHGLGGQTLCRRGERAKVYFN